MKTIRLLLISALVAVANCRAAPLPEPGPENGGMRLRLMVNRETGGSNETCRVQLDLIHVTVNPILLTAHWPHEEKGDFKNYLEAALSMETDPPIHRWQGQVVMDHRVAPQAEFALGPKQTLHLEWQAANRQLKNQVSRPLEVQNPRFPTDGLYSVHGVVVLRTASGSYLLRSNEQLVPIGGSDEMPKHPLGTVYWADAAKKTAGLSLGSLHKTAPGDKFLIRTGMSVFWCLIVDRVAEDSSSGSLVTCDRWGRAVPETKQPFPKPGVIASLITEKPPVQ